MKYSLLVLVLLAACGDGMGPGMGLEAGPGSPECRRAMREWVTAPGDNVYNPSFGSIQKEVLSSCTGPRRNGGGGSDDKPEGNPT